MSIQNIPIYHSGNHTIFVRMQVETDQEGDYLLTPLQVERLEALHYWIRNTITATTRVRRTKRFYWTIEGPQPVFGNFHESASLTGGLNFSSPLVGVGV